MADNPDEVIYTDSYGHVSRRQLENYRKHNVSPADHDDLVDYFGRGSHAGMAHAAGNSMFRAAGSTLFSSYLFSQWARKHPRPQPAPEPMTKVIMSSAIAACPKRSLLPAHYNVDGTCRCSQRADAQLAVDMAGQVAADATDALAQAKAWLAST